MAKNRNTESAATTKPRGGRKPATKYSISLANQRSVIDQLAKLYDKEPVEIIADLGALYEQNSFAPHFSRLQGEYSAARQEAEEEALAKIHAAVNGDGGGGEDDEPTIEELPLEDVRNVG